MKLKLKEYIEEEDEKEPLIDELIKEWAEMDVYKFLSRRLSFDQFVKEADKMDRIASRDDYEKYCDYYDKAMTQRQLNWKRDWKHHCLWKIHQDVCDELSLDYDVEMYPFCDEYFHYSEYTGIDENDVEDGDQIPTVDLMCAIYDHGENWQTVIPFDYESKFMDKLGKQYINDIKQGKHHQPDFEKSYYEDIKYFIQDPDNIDNRDWVREN